MNHNAPQLADKVSQLTSKPVLRTLIAYEDRETSDQACRMYDRMVREFSEVCDFQSDLLDLGVLSVPKLRELAGEEAATADMIIIACHAGSDPTESFQQWCCEWQLHDRTHESALVALFDGEHGPMKRAVEHLAHNSQLTFIPHVMRGSQGGNATTRSSQPQQTGRVLPCGQFPDQDTWSRWGINE